MLNKTTRHEPAVGYGHHGGPTTTTHTTTAGHPSSGMRTVRGENTSGLASGTHATTGGSGYVEYGRTPASGPAPKTAGPHRHDVANKLDPRVDSSHDHAPVMSNPEPHAHKSKLANVLDPRVDSSVANGRHHHAAVGGTGAGMGSGMGSGIGPATGAHTTHGARTGGVHAGPGVATTGHTTRSHGAMGVAPVAGTGTHTHAAGTTHATPGPHSSSLMNKLDPRVDSRTGMTNTSAGTTRY